MNEKPEVLEIASKIELATTCGFIGSAAQYEHLLLSAVSQLRRLHARVQELEKDRGNAKRLVSKIWDKHPEARGAIEEGTGAWLVFGQDVETSCVSAQRVTQSQPLKTSSDWLIEGGLLYRLNDRGTNCDEINVTMAGGLRTEAARIERAEEILNMLKAVQQAEDCIEQPLEMVAAPAELNLDDCYCKGCGRIGEIEELNAQDKEKLRKIEGKPKTVAAPVVLPEADTHCFDEDTQKDVWSYSKEQVLELLAKGLGAVNLDRLGKALTKLGHATWVSQEESAADIPYWVNALTSCVLEIPEAAPQPQADARDAEAINMERAKGQRGLDAAIAKATGNANSANGQRVAAPVVRPSVAGQINFVPGTSTWEQSGDSLSVRHHKAGDEPCYLYTKEQLHELLNSTGQSIPHNQEPFGYFKAENYGWIPCAEADEGAVALYTAPQPQEVREPLAANGITQEKQG